MIMINILVGTDKLPSRIINGIMIIDIGYKMIIKKGLCGVTIINETLRDHKTKIN